MLSTAIRKRKVADTEVPMMLVVLGATSCVVHLGVQRPDAEVQQHGQGEDHGGVTEREEEPDAERAFPSLMSLRVVLSMADVVGVEGVAHPERVGQMSQSRNRTPRSG